MGLRAGMSVRFSAELSGRLERVADRAGLAKSDLIRIALEEYLDKVEREGVVQIYTGNITKAARAADSEGGYVIARKGRKKQNDHHDPSTKAG
jgi:predicted DNA-binding protein